MNIFSVISEINLLVVLRLGHRKRDIEGKRAEKQCLLKKKLGEDEEWRRERRDLSSREVTIMLR